MSNKSTFVLTGAPKFYATELTNMSYQITQIQTLIPNFPVQQSHTVPVWAVLADLLVCEGSSQHLLQYGDLAEGLEAFVQTVHQAVEELQGIVLVAQVYRLTP